MAGLGAESVVPVRPELAVNLRPLDFSVQQNAVAAVSEAFRAGQISYDDIAARYGALAKGKEKMQIQGIDEFLNPAAIQTRQNQQAALNTEAILKSSPEYIASREAEMQATINTAQAGDYPAMLKAAIGLGFFPQNRDATWTPEKMREAEQLFSDARNYKAFSEKSSRDAKRFLPAKEPLEKLFINAKGEQERSVESPTGEDVNYFDENNQHIPKEVKFAADRAAGMSAEDWVRAGRPAYDPYGSLVTERAAPAAAKAQVDPPVYDTETSTVEKRADGSSKETLVKKVARITKQEITPVAEKKANESQTKAILAVPGVVSAETNMDELKTMGWDNTTWGAAGWSIVAAALPGVVEKPLETAGRKLFENAVSSFKEGMLRLSSGGAITEPEHVNYREMYFPMPRDPIQLVQSKEKLRAEMGEMVAKLATQNLHTPEKGSIEEKNIQAIHARALRAQSGVGATSTQAGRPATASTVTPVTGGSVGFTPGKGYVFTAGTPSTNAAPVVTPRQPFFFGQ